MLGNEGVRIKGCEGKRTRECENKKIYLIRRRVSWDGQN